MSSSGSEAGASNDKRSQVKNILRMIDDCTKKEDEEKNDLIDQDLYGLDEPAFKYFFGIHRSDFLDLFVTLEETLTEEYKIFKKSDRKFRRRDLLLICLRYVAEGRSFEELSLKYSLPTDFIANIVAVVTKIIIDCLKPVVMPEPSEELWKANAQVFKTMHGLPNCIGAVHATRVHVDNGSSTYLFTLVNANYEFAYIDVSSHGVNKKLPVAFNRSNLAKKLAAKELHLPAEEAVEEGGLRLPYVIVGPSILQNKPYLLNKYRSNLCHDNEAHKIFNERLCYGLKTACVAMKRCRRRFRILKRTVPASPQMGKDILFTVAIVYNRYCVKQLAVLERPGYEVSEEKKEALRASLPAIGNTKLMFEHYFLSAAGDVPWQWQALNPQKTTKNQDNDE